MIVKFNKIATFVAGQSPESKYYSNTAGTPFLQGNRTFGQFYPTIDTYTSKITKLAKKGDILMSVRAPVGDLNFANQDICIGRGLAAISSKDGDNEFLFYALRYNIENLKRQSGGTTFDSVTKDIIEDMDMIIPDDKTSYPKIKRFLFDIDNKIDTNNQILNKIIKLLTDIYDRYFLQYDFLIENAPYKSNGGELIHGDKMNIDFPTGWKEASLSEMIEEITTGLNPRDNFKLTTKGIKYVTVKNITANGSLDFHGCDYVDAKSRDMIHERSGVAKGHILFSSIAPLGRCYLVNEDPVDWEINESVFCIKPKKELFKYYLYMLFISNHFIQRAENSSTGSVFNGLRISTMLEMDVLIPNDDILVMFNEDVKTLFDEMYAIQKENEKLKELSDDLLPMLMNGQIVIK